MSVNAEIVQADATAPTGVCVCALEAVDLPDCYSILPSAYAVIVRHDMSRLEAFVKSGAMVIAIQDTEIDIGGVAVLNLRNGGKAIGRVTQISEAAMEIFDMLPWKSGRFRVARGEVASVDRVYCLGLG